MKKFFLTILTFFYLLLSTGFTLDVHYCMGSIASIDITSSEDATCAKCGMKEKNTGCCRDEVKFYKFEKGFKSTKSIQLDHPFIAIADAVFVVHSHSVVSIKPTAITSIEPLIGGPPIYLRNRVFRI